MSNDLFLSVKYDIFRAMWEKAYGLENRGPYDLRFGQAFYNLTFPNVQMDNLDKEEFLFNLEGLKAVDVLDKYFEKENTQ